MAHLIKARIVGEDAELGPVSSVTLYGHELTREFGEPIEVDDFVFGKLKGNRFVEVLVPKPAAEEPKARTKAKEPAAEEPKAEA
jgi:hypothetical protein